MENIFDIINVPLGYIISFCYKLIPNYAIALLLFAIIVKVITLPFGIKQQKNMVKQASLRPKEMAIRKRYAGRTDKATQQKLNEEIMNLYQKENFNPMGGCLPMLIQFPVLIAVYNIVINPLKYICGFTSDTVTLIGKKINELYVNGMISTEGISQTILTKLDKVKDAVLNGGKTVEELGVSLTGIENVSVMRNIDFSHFDGIIPEGFTASSLPDFTIFGGSFDLGQVPSISPLNILIIIPIITFIAVFFGMKLTKKFMYQPQAAATGNAAASNKIMDFMMPLLSVWISFTVPAVVGVYWIYQQILGTVQQFALAKMYPYPVFTEEDMKLAEKQMNGSVRKKKKVRSLHRIEEEDEEETVDTEPETVSAPKAAEKGSEKGKKKDASVGGLIEKAPLKEDKNEDKPEKKPENEDKDGE